MVADDVPKKIPRMADELDEVLETPLSSPSNRKLKSRPSVMNGRGLAELKDVKLREKSFALSLAFLLGTHPARNAASVLGKGRFADGNAEDVLRLILHHLAIDLKVWRYNDFGISMEGGTMIRHNGEKDEDDNGQWSPVGNALLSPRSRRESIMEKPPALFRSRLPLGRGVFSCVLHVERAHGGEYSDESLGVSSGVYDPNDCPDYLETARFNLTHGWVGADLVRGTECTLGHLKGAQPPLQPDWNRDIEDEDFLEKFRKTASPSGKNKIAPEGIEGGMKVAMRVKVNRLEFKVSDGPWRKACDGLPDPSQLYVWCRLNNGTLSEVEFADQSQGLSGGTMREPDDPAPCCSLQ